MPYALWSRGRLIGHTDLGFVRCLPNRRTGWFHPTAEGERVMAIAVAVPPAIEAYVARTRELTCDVSEVQDELDRSTEGADLSAAFHHLEALDFQLRRDDGSVVPTEDVGIVDTHRLIALARELTEHEEAEEWGDVGDLFHDDDDDAAESIDDMLLESDDFREWAIGNVGRAAHPRYQIQVALFDDAVIP